MAIASVVIPAHNEETLIASCIESILRDAAPHELEIVVVCNACTDRSAEVARRGGEGVTVVETDVASKSHALNLGDAAATTFPRLYVDADVRMDTDSVRAVAAALTDDPAAPLAAAPVIDVDVSSSSWPVRSYYRVWTSLPWVTDSMIGSGVYALSERGRARFEEFPDVKADDFWVSAQFAPGERLSVGGASFRVPGAATLRLLVRRKARILAYNRLLAEELVGAPGRQPRTGGGSLRQLATEQPSMVPSLVLYVAVAVVADGLARWKIRTGSLDWVTDRT